jgi:hypothetical protein
MGGSLEKIVLAQPSHADCCRGIPGLYDAPYHLRRDPSRSWETHTAAFSKGFLRRPKRGALVVLPLSFWLF